MAEGDEPKETSRSIGRLEGRLEAVRQQNIDLREAMNQGFERIEARFKDMLAEVRDRYHAQQGEAHRHLTSIDADLLRIRTSIEALDQKVDTRIKTIENNVTILEGKVKTLKDGRTTTNRWIVGIATFVATVVSIAVSLALVVVDYMKR